MKFSCLFGLLFLLGAKLTLASSQPNYNRSFFSDDPINLNTRSLVMDQPLFDLGGPLPLTFGLRYDSESNFEPGWGPTIPTLSRPNPNSVYIERMDGGSVVLAFDNTEFDGTGEWVASVYCTYRYALQEEAGAYGWFYLMDPDQAYVYCFEKDGEDDDSYDQSARLRYLMDRNGNTLSYTYSPWASVTNISDGLGRELDFYYWNGNLSAVSNGARAFYPTYRSRYQLERLVDPEGGTNAYEYFTSSSRNLTRHVKPEGNAPYTQTYQNEYDGWVATQADAYSNVTVVTFVNNDYPTQDVVVLTRPDGRNNQYVHDASGAAPLSLTDAEGQRAEFTADIYDRSERIVDRLGGTTSLGYHEPTGFLSTITNALGAVLHHSFSPQTQTFTNPANAHVFTFTFHTKTRTDFPDGTFEGFAYDERGNLTNYTDRTGAAWSTTRSAQGLPVIMTNPMGGVVSNAYNADGTLASQWSSDTGTESYAYDAYKRLISVTPPGSPPLRIEYDGMDRITAMIDENSRTNRFEYDRNGNLTAAIDPGGNRVTHAYDLMDRLINTSNRLGGVETITYGALGTATNHLDQNGLSTALAIDSRLRLVGWTQQGQALEFERDQEGLPTRRTTPTGRSVRMDYDALGQVTNLVYADGSTRSFERDAMTRITNQVDALNRSTRYAYDAVGRLVSVEKSDGTSASYTRNAAGQLTVLRDGRGQDWRFEYTPMGRLAALIDPLARTNRFTHDARGRVATVTFADDHTEQRTYDASGLMTNRLFSDATDISYAYDQLGLLTNTAGLALTRNANGQVVAESSAGLTLTTAYDAGGRVTNVNYNGAFQVAYQYDMMGLLSQVDDSLGHGVSLFYDPDGLLTNLVRRNGTTASYQYDAHGRLSALTDAGVIDLTYVRDADGQFLGAEGEVPINPADVQTSTQEAFAVDAAAQLTGPGYAYDDRGRAIALPGQTLGWDDADRLVQMNSTTLAYNGLHELSARVEGTQTNTLARLHALARSPVAAEIRNGLPLRYHVHTPDGRLLYSLDPQDGYAPSYLHTDHLGSVLALSDAAGLVTDRYAYDADGQLLAHSGSSDQPFTYLGSLGVRREGTLYQMGVRYYDPRSARFLSREPLWPQVHDPDLLYPYQYALGQPLRYSDASGLAPEERFSSAYYENQNDDPPDRPMLGTPDQFKQAEFDHVHARNWSSQLSPYAGPELASYMAALKVAWQRNPNPDAIENGILKALMKKAKADHTKKLQFEDYAVTTLLGNRQIRAESWHNSTKVNICGHTPILPSFEYEQGNAVLHPLQQQIMVLEHLAQMLNPGTVQRMMLGGFTHE